MKYGLFITLLLFLSCAKKPKNPIELALASDQPAIQAVMANLEAHEVQIIFTQIERSKDSVFFKDYEFQVDASHYFYPASTVKLPAAILALEYISEHKHLNAHTSYTISRDTLVHTITDDVRQIFAVSDNEAYNRLYELLGRDEINKRLLQKEIAPKSRFAHRLSTTNASQEQRLPIYFDNDTIDAIPDKHIQPLQIDNCKKGKGFIKDGELIPEPMDFSLKNYFPLRAQHEVLKRLFFPDAFIPSQRFNLSKDDRNLLLQAMKTVPRHQGYSEENYYDSYGKFFMYGDTKDPIPEHINIYNKVGYAYGTLTDTAFIKDEKNDIAFILSATILVNGNGIFNDDTYEYDEVGIPFLAQLGRALYAMQKDKN